MRTSQKGFTLVELIVVITILAILGTIAFISLQGYSQDAKNSKVTSDLRTLSTAVETSLTNGNLTIANLVKNDTDATATRTAHAVTGDFASGVTLDTSNYNVGKINFVALRQNGDDFVDPDGKEYIVGVAYAGNTAYYQLVGEIKLASGNYEAVTSGNYVQEDSDDVAGLVSRNGDSAPIKRGDNLTTDGLGAPPRP